MNSIYQKTVHWSAGEINSLVNLAESSKRCQSQPNMERLPSQQEMTDGPSVATETHGAD